ncbi:hypothetical protein Tco_0384472, partial [Tanacetum coccineum]
MDASDLARIEVMSLCTQVVAQQAMITELQVAYSGGSTVGNDYRATGSRPQETGGDYKDVDGRPREAEPVHKGTEAAEETSDLDDRVRETAGTRQRSCTARCTRGG